MNTDEHRFYMLQRQKTKNLNGTRINTDERG
jgi:hypothetical protein